tara:strand:- start:1946 stop:2653 length:708 start_codon:yes stop_codon:yes gene_type:complete
MKFGVENKSFTDDVEILFNALKSKEKFAFSKYADGEYEILINNKITNCDNWTFNPEIHKKEREELLSSYNFNEEGYFVGISCPCCVGQRDAIWMKNMVGVKVENLTWANIFVNANFNFFHNFVEEFANHDIILVANKDVKIENLPFKVEEHIPIGNTAFIENFDLVETLPKKDYKNKLFLFCAGPLGNMLAAKMWKENKNNIYLDIGSTLNRELTGLSNRGYLMGSDSINKICKW